MRSLLRFYDASDPRTSSHELRDLGKGRRIDRDTLAAQLCQDATLKADATLYEGVRSDLLPTAFGPAPPPADPEAFRQAPERRVHDIVRSAVERAIGDATGIGVFASGGIDSAVILAHATEILRARGGRAVALAIDFPGPGDDRPHLLALQSYLSCEVVRVCPEDGARHVDRLGSGVDAAPMLWAFAPIQLALFEAARKSGVERVLTGVGGDDFFDGDPRALAALAVRHPLDAVRRARTLEHFDPPRHPVLEYIVRPFVVPLVPKALRRWRTRRARSAHATSAWAGPRLKDIARKLTERDIEAAISGPSGEVDYFAMPGQRYFAWLVHQEQRAQPVERFDPMFTRAVASAVAAIPAHLLLARNRRRGLFRESMRGRLPDSLLDRDDKAEFAPAFPSFVRAMGGLDVFREELEGRCLDRLELVDRRHFHREIRAAIEEPAGDGRYALAWAALAAEAFLLRHPEIL